MNGLLARWSFRLCPLGSLARAPGDPPPFAVSGAASLTTRLLAIRGVRDSTSAAAFMDPRLTQLHDPSLIPDLDLAAERALRAIKVGEPVVIYEPDHDDDPVPPDPPGEEGESPSAEEPTGVYKVRVSGVPARIISERIEYIGPDGSLITESYKDFSRKTILGKDSQANCCHACWYAWRNSSRVMLDCVRIVLSVDPLICR